MVMEEEIFYDEWNDKYPYPTIVMKDGSRIELIERIGAPINGNARVFFRGCGLREITIEICDVERFEKVSRENAKRLELIINEKEVMISVERRLMKRLKAILKSLR